MKGKWILLASFCIIIGTMIQAQVDFIQEFGVFEQSEDDLHFHDESCSDVLTCACSMSGMYYQAECLAQGMFWIPRTLSFNITLLAVQGTQLPNVTQYSLSPYFYLEALYFPKNQINWIESGLLEDYIYLKIFIINENQLKSLEASLFEFNAELEEFDAHDNVLTDFPDFNGLDKLKYVHLQGNKLAQVPSGYFAGCQSMTDLNLADNLLVGLSDNIFSGLINLINLDMSNNKLNTISSGTFRGLNQLTQAYMSGNELTSIPANIFPDSTQLTNLDLSDNEVDTIASGAFSALLNLESIWLSNNRLTSVPQALNDLDKLTALYLDGNLFTTIPAEAFSGLSTLNQLFLRDMDTLSSVHTEAFKGLTELTRLILAENEALTDFTPAHLPAIEHTQLENIYLNDNGFVYLDEAIFSDKPSLSLVELYGNKFNCSCDLKWMPRVVAEGVIWAQHWANSGSPPTCYTPAHLTGYDIPDMLEEDMTCDELVIEPGSPIQQTVHLRENVNITVHLYIGLPSSRWLTPDQTTIIPFPAGDPFSYRVYATYEKTESNAMEAILHINNASASDQGNYMVTATNIVGDKTMSFQLEVLPYELTTTTNYQSTEGYIGRANTWHVSLSWLLVLNVIVQSMIQS